MSQREVYLVSDYNPKYLDGPIVSCLASMLSDIQSEEDDVIEEFRIDMEEEVKGLSRDSSKAILSAEIETGLEMPELVNRLNGMIRVRISDQAIYSVSVSGSSGTEYGV